MSECKRGNINDGCILTVLVVIKFFGILIIIIKKEEYVQKESKQ